MGCVAGISATEFPEQYKHVGKRAAVCFNYDTRTILNGTIVRDDEGAPHETIIKLDDGRYVRAAECMYSWSNDQ